MQHIAKRLEFHATSLGLAMVDPADFTLERRPHGRGHKICFANGDKVTDRRLKERIRQLVLPPAWKDVRICVDENGHIQATGRDEKGRLQYRYHDRWVNVRNAVKTERLLRFGRVLPRLRRRIDLDMRRSEQDERMTAAAAARLIDISAMRPGHEKYAQDGGRGVASLDKGNLRIGRQGAVLSFVGKSRKEHRIEVKDRRLINSLTRIRKGNGKRLFRFKDKDRTSHILTANRLNAYLHESGHARISAKDFRTFRGSAEALRHLIDVEGPLADTQAKRRRAVARAMRAVSDVLRNTPAVARTSYVHPDIVLAFEEGRLDFDLLKGRSRTGLTREETGLMRFLEETAAR